MPALFVHTTRSDGTTLTADIYNGDFQNIITNGDAAGFGGYSANATQMQATTDPGEVSSENLAASIADEFERLRFSEKEQKGTDQWYESLKTRTESLGVVGTPNSLGTLLSIYNVWPDAVVLSTVQLQWRVPEAYASGDITFKVIRRAGSTGTGTAVMDYDVFRFRDAAAISVVTTAGALNFTPGDLLSHAQTITVAAAAFQVGDILGVVVSRRGTNGSDTMTDTVSCDGCFVSYTAYAGRP